MTVDLVARSIGAINARTWSNDGGGGFGQREFTPGTYLAVIEIDGENMESTLVERFRISVPEAPEGEGSHLEMEYVQPRSPAQPHR